MDKVLADNLIDPESATTFTLEDPVYNAAGNVESGFLVAGTNRFPVINGIPRIVELANYASNFGFQWNRHRQTQLDSFAGINISEKRIAEVTGTSPAVWDGKRILEAGSGAGRFSEIFLKYKADLFSFDYSTAVDANWLNNHSYPGFHLFQGNIYEIPFKPATFDAVFCLGVIQHTPDPGASFKCLAEQVKPGGQLYIDAYRKSAYSLFSWKYLLRPFLKNMNQKALYRLVVIMVNIFLPLSVILVKLLGNLGTKFLPVADFHSIKLPSYAVRRSWSILDTYDWYSPAYDFPQTAENVRQWFSQNGFTDIQVYNGSNGVIGRGTKV